MFGKLFGKKDKEEEGRSALDMTIRDLKVNDFIDYELESWQVRHVYRYDWGNNFFTQEYQLDNGKEKIYVHIDDDDELEINVSKKAKIFQINDLLVDHIIEHEEPMKRFQYNDKTFYYDSESPGEVCEDGEDEWSQFINWEFTDEDETETITIQRWGEREFEAYVGKPAQEFEFSNIIPGSN